MSPDHQPEAIEGTSVLLATRAEPSIGSLRTARDIAASLRLPLEVVHVLEEPNWPSRGVLDGSQAQRGFERFVETARTSTRYYCTVLGEQFADRHLVVRVGRFDEQVTFRAEELDAALVMVATGELPGRHVTALARRLGRPVWVASGGLADTPNIIAATDLSDAAYPVLRCAKQLADLRAASVIAVHRAPQGLRRGIATLPMTPRARHNAQAAGVELARASDGLGLDHFVLLHAGDCADAILAEAQALAADTIVIGTHVRSPLTRALHRSVAASVIDRARRSVVVQPLASERSFGLS